MIAMRICHKCHRRFDAVYPSNKTICPMCEQGEMFRGEFTDEEVFIPDVREPHEEPYKQPAQVKKKLEKMYGLDCTTSWEDDIDEDDFLTGDLILQQDTESDNKFEPLLITVEQPQIAQPKTGGVKETSEKAVGTPGKRKSKASVIQVKRRKDPYMKEGGT